MGTAPLFNVAITKSYCDVINELGDLKALQVPVPAVFYDERLFPGHGHPIVRPKDYRVPVRKNRAMKSRAHASRFRARRGITRIHLKIVSPSQEPAIKERAARAY